MYIPPHFQLTDPAALGELFAAFPLAAVVAQTEQGLLANHLPLVAQADGSFIGHVALANEMHRLIGPETEVLAIFRGPEGYISPNFYPSKAEHHRHVPTWNYEVAHVYGHLIFDHDLRAKRAAVGLLTKLHEGALNGPDAWRMAQAPADYMAQMLAAIVAFRLIPTRILAKAKLSQNREARDYQGVVEGLEVHGQTALAARMRRAP